MQHKGLLEFAGNFFARWVTRFLAQFATRKPPNFPRQNKMNELRQAPNPFDWEAIFARIALARKNVASDSSRKAYQNSVLRFVTYLLHENKTLVDHGFVDLLGDLDELNETQIRAKIKSILNDDSTINPVNLDIVTHHDFLEWILSLKKKDGSELGYQRSTIIAVHSQIYFAELRNKCQQKWTLNYLLILKELDA